MHNCSVSGKTGDFENFHHPKYQRDLAFPFYKWSWSLSVLSSLFQPRKTGPYWGWLWDLSWPFSRQLPQRWSWYRHVKIVQHFFFLILSLTGHIWRKWVVKNDKKVWIGGHLEFLNVAAYKLIASLLQVSGNCFSKYLAVADGDWLQNHRIFFLLAIHTA